MHENIFGGLIPLVVLFSMASDIHGGVNHVGFTPAMHPRRCTAGEKTEKAVFAGGCFWCMVLPFEKLNGVIEVTAGYTGGTGKSPTYEDYAQKGHVEAVQITYDPSRVSFSELLDLYWKQVDPTDSGGQFGDRGAQYRTVIFYHGEEQRKLAEESRERLDKSGRYKKPLRTEIVRASGFYPAEEYHQEYHRKNSLRYKLYRLSSGRDRFLEKIWGKGAGSPSVRKEYGKPTKEELRKKLTPLQYKVTQENATERPFGNQYWNNKKEGLYVDIVSGEPLFSSLDKFDSGCGWPSFTKPLAPETVTEKKSGISSDTRTEVRSRRGDSHLGHVFNDGPKPAGLRYCINSAALRFIPKEDLEKEGYGRYKKLFEKPRLKK